MRILITSGPTREPLDRVRFISNRSSGRMGLALTQAAAAAGHQVTLLSGPVPLPRLTSEGVRSFRFVSTDDLQRLLQEHFPKCDILIMAAAVADYRSEPAQSGKLRRLDPGEGRTEPLNLQLIPTPDLVATVATHKRSTQKIIAFALEESAQLELRAREKLCRKAVDVIVANPLETLDSDHVEAIVLFADGRRIAPGPLCKSDFATWLVGQLAGL